jgi:tRNA/rRNA methyltransferase
MVGAGTDHTKPEITGGPAIVLVRPQLAVNIGMAARAMVNFGLSDLRLVAPRGDLTREDAHAAAAGAVHVFENARIFATLAEAVADLQFVWATTARERGQGKRVELPANGLPETAARMAAGERHGILFGPERTGLDNDEVATADAIVTFPVNPAYASLNLAQAVLLVGYEWSRANGAAAPFGTVERSPPARRDVVLSFFDYLEGELERTGFFRPEGKQPGMRRNLRNIFHRIGLTEQDVRTLRGAVVRLVEGPRTSPQTRRRNRPAPAPSEDPAET